MAADLLEDEAEAHVRGVCFKTGPPERTGVELEWLVQDRSDPHEVISVDRLDAALAPVEAPDTLPRGGRLTREPGGQVELSSPPAPTLAACVEATAADLAVLRQAMDRAGLVLVGRGLDPYREPPRVLDHPRYRAMEGFFDREGPWGRTMMRRTASLQVNLDAGDDTDGVSGYRYRWDLVHRLGPVLVAAFANSPMSCGRPTGWVSTRQATWARMDPGRTHQPDRVADPGTSWARYALDAKLLCVPGDEYADWSAPPDLTFRDWLRGAPGLRAPTAADLDYHLSTLFPPVRPRGWLELRMIDAQDGDDWMVVTALTAALLDDPVAADAAYAATEPLCQDGEPVPADEIWQRAARIGPADPDLAKAARACFAAAESALARSRAPVALRQALTDFADRYPDRGRCPAHDLLDALSRA
ncbi:glutamate--cysteine ligase [Streptomyces sp. DvalAA-14]|uniref:ergothioneine biosynthesis glutamate--cysteine ligase EgtA n=1 Tax=unclassified Streptomyces TaxID=2593676 RepID=UPI00081B4D9C|nr:MULTISPECIES: ergothioneine biosynthesis glutamate--cysteine ligase EgtA [unclassified Streptomyces]MYS20552.1 ergothioneine biosynthesis glutamate--cysteine ligase EgtA [Streptomyces sp. SID4948]SCD71557.1 glutamate--cysteine ligase [Streptomyces sp. DvalAA-14]